MQARGVVLLTALFLTLLQCKGDKKKSQPSPPPAIAEENPPPDQGGSDDAEKKDPEPADRKPTSSRALGELLQVCNKDFGRVWDPQQLTCSEPLTSFPCCKEQILARYGALSKEIEAAFAENQDLQLYNCGEADQGTKLYWVSVTGTRYRYAYFQINGRGSQTLDTDFACSGEAAKRTGEVKAYDGSVDGIGPSESVNAPVEGTTDPASETAQTDPSDTNSGNQTDDDGEALFNLHCQSCHNSSQNPIQNTDLAAIKNAIANTEPMKFIGNLKQLSDSELQQIASYLGRN